MQQRDPEKHKPHIDEKKKKHLNLKQNACTCWENFSLTFKELATWTGQIQKTI